MGATAPAVVSPVGAQAPTPGATFQHGVASGDPTQTAVVIWTRVTPPTGSARPTPATWTVAADPGFRRIVAQGVVAATADRDFTVKVDVQGLQPGRPYWYRFTAAREASPVGRTLTLADGPLSRLILAVASCANREFGLFNAYDAISRLPEVDVVLCLGDYIYESGPEESLIKRGIGRALEPPHALVGLADYRARHAQYKRDPDLQAAHARTAWICTWDDHEAANNCWTGGAGGGADMPWTQRKAAALRAYYEWMPLREPAPGKAFEAINRSFQFGDLASLIMLETRLMARADQLDYERDVTYRPGPDGAPTPDLARFRARLNDPSRQMLGDRQQAWLEAELRASTASGRAWQILGSQVLMAPVAGPNIRTILGPTVSEAMLLTLPKRKRARIARLAQLFSQVTPYNLDAWDGYPAARRRVYAACASAGAHAIVLSGDSHAFWANELADERGAPIAVEFGVGAIANTGVGDYAIGLPVDRAFTEANPAVRFCDHAAKGFVLVRLTPSVATAELVAVSTVRSKPYDTRVLKRYRVGRAAGGIGALREV